MKMQFGAYELEFDDSIAQLFEKHVYDTITDSALTYVSARTGIENAEEKWHNISCKVYKIRNDFFGETITVTGLITGQDLIAQLKNQQLGDVLLLTSNMIKRDSDLFLDDCTISEVEKALNVKIKIIDNDGFSLFDAITGN